MGQTWYYAKGDREVGPLKWDELKDLAAAGLLGPDDDVWSDRSGARHRAADVPGLLGGAGEHEPGRYFVCYPGGPDPPDGPFTADELRTRVPPDLLGSALVNPAGTEEWRRFEDCPEVLPRPGADPLDGFLLLAALVGAAVGWLGVVFRANLIEGAEGFWSASISGIILGVIVGTISGLLGSAVANRNPSPTAPRIAGPRWSALTTGVGAVVGVLSGGPGWWQVAWLVAGGGIGFAFSRNARLRSWCAAQAARTSSDQLASKPGGPLPVPARSGSDAGPDPAGPGENWLLSLTAAIAVGVPVVAVWAYRWVFYTGAGWDTSRLPEHVGGLACVLSLVAAAVYWAARAVALVLSVPRGQVDRSATGRTARLAAVAVGCVAAGILVSMNHRSLSSKRDLQASFIRRAIRHQATESHQEAIVFCDIILEDTPPNARVYLLRAESYLAVGDLDRAIADLTEVIRLDHPDVVGTALNLRADALEKKGDPAAARRDRERSDQLTGSVK